MRKQSSVSNKTTLKILITGDPASGKTTTAKALEKGLGIPAFHTDTFRFKDAVTLAPYEEFKNKVKGVITKNESYIIEGADFGDEAEFLDMILSDADIILIFDIPPSESINKWFKRIDKTEPQEHLGFNNDPNYDGGVKQVRFMLEWYHWYLDRKEQMQQRLKHFMNKVITVQHHTAADKVIAYLTAGKFKKSKNGINFLFDPNSL